MSRYLVLVITAAVLVSASQTAFVSDSQPVWKQIISLLFSRGLYFVLGILILGCFAVTAIRNKIEETTGRSDGKMESTWSAQSTVVKSFLMPSADYTDIHSNRTTLSELYSANSNQDLLKEAEARNNALKRELDQLNRIRLSLEERSGVLEREKAAVEDQLEESKLQAALENESLRKEAAAFQRQLQQLQEEREMLQREVASAARESRMTDCALKDQALLTERLEAARQEVAELQKGLEALRQERDTAVAIAADLAVRCQGVAGESTHMIGKYIKREMERHRALEKSKLNSVTDSITDENADLPEDSAKKENYQDDSRGDSSQVVQAEEEGSEKTKIDDVCDGNNGIAEECNCPECSISGDRWNNMELLGHQEEQCLHCNELGLGPVTGSEAFRNFLISSFSEQ